MAAPSQIFSGLVGYILRGLIQTYRYLLAPLLPTRCRYLPTCSHYGLEAIQLHGPVHGSWLTLRRFARCHPWGGHGYDPVPQGSITPTYSARHGANIHTRIHTNIRNR